MKRRILCLLSAVLVLAAAFSFVPHIAAAASATVDMSFTPSPAEAGKNVTVTVSVKADEAIGIVEAYLIYDPDLLTFVSGDSASGGGGSVNIIGVGNGSSKTISYNLTFTALKNGVGNVQVTSSNVISYATEESIGGGVAYCYVQIGSSATATPTASATATATPSATTAPSSTATPNPTSTPSMTATPSATSTPTPSAGTTPTAEPTEGAGGIGEGDSVRIEVDGRVLYLWPSLADVTLPDGFWAASYTYKDSTVQVARGDYKNMLLFYLTDSNGENGRFYVYDETADKFTMLINIDVAAASYSFVDVDSTLQVPEGYVEAAMYVGEEQVPAWILPSDTEGRYALVYVMNPSGEAAFYVYDSQEKTMQRYVDRTVTTEVPVEVTPTGEPTEEPAVTPAETRNLLQRIWDDKGFLTMSVILIVLLIGAAVLIGWLCIRYVGKDQDSDDDSVYTIGHDDTDPPKPPTSTPTSTPPAARPAHAASPAQSAHTTPPASTVRTAAPAQPARAVPPVQPVAPEKEPEAAPPARTLLRKPQRRVGFEDTEGYDPDVHPSRGMQNPLIPPDDYVPPQTKGLQPLGKHGQRPADSYDNTYAPPKQPEPARPHPAPQPQTPPAPQRVPEDTAPRAEEGFTPSPPRPASSYSRVAPVAAPAAAEDDDVKTYQPHSHQSVQPPSRVPPSRGSFQVRQASQTLPTTGQPSRTAPSPTVPPVSPSGEGEDPAESPRPSGSPKWR